MTTETAPIRKLYKRCKRGRHADCPGSFEAHSVCECSCHVDNPGETESGPESVVDMVSAAVVEAAQAIVTAPAPAAPKRTKAKAKPAEEFSLKVERHEADYTLRGVKDHSAYGFFDPCDLHADKDLAEIIAFGRSERSRSTAADCIRRALLGCEVCKQRTCNAMAAWAATQADVPQAIAYKYPAKYRPTRMSRESFIAKYDNAVLLAGSYDREKNNAVTSSINRCANRQCTAIHNGMVVLHDTDELCGSCVYAGVKPRKRSK